MKKAVSYRLNAVIANKITAWSMVQSKDKTAIIEEAFAMWESAQPKEQRRKVESIVKQLQ